MKPGRTARGEMLQALGSPDAMTVCLTLPNAPESVAKSRRFVRSQLSEWGCPERAHDAVLICSELATNAVQHVPPGPNAGEFLVVLTFVAGKALVAQVADSSSAQPMATVSPPQALDTSGRGLLIVTALADYWGATPRAGGQGKIVSAYMRLRQTAPRSPEPADLDGYLTAQDEIVATQTAQAAALPPGPDPDHTVVRLAAGDPVDLIVDRGHAWRRHNPTGHSSSSRLAMEATAKAGR
ncbi:ATP-binding protein [Streptomyces sp. NPDC001502]|uniref:ATP-binding protein n=1 Tax=Streptomyces sp. NPDC001502 TaxID=3364578 RepID=UPI0036AA0519